ncbi:MAG: hypothetical protein AB7V13_24415 [Pseudorhodoplanes sp.]|uniref:SH3 domain-containing protein n=1 Tax=Pseudorhodoplanes sp. TaxID=1934341 RepID=UPI003D0D0A82
MIRTIICTALVGVATVSYARTALAEGDDLEKASKLLELALACPSPVADSSGSKTKMVLKSVGNKSELSIALSKTDVWMGPIEFGARSREMKQEIVVSARFSDLSTPAIRKGDVELRCIKGKACISEWWRSQRTCETGPDEPEHCSEIEPSATGTDRTAIFGACKDQLGNIKLAITLLIEGAKNSPGEGSAYRVSTSKKLISIPIRKEPDSKSLMVGALPTGVSVAYVSDCKAKGNSKHKWCKINWGGTDGYVSLSRLVPLQGR